MMIRQLFLVKIFQLKEKKWLKSVHKQENLALVVQFRQNAPNYRKNFVFKNRISTQK